MVFNNVLGNVECIIYILNSFRLLLFFNKCKVNTVTNMMYKHVATVQTLLLFLNNAHEMQINHKKVQQKIIFFSIQESIFLKENAN